MPFKTLGLDAQITKNLSYQTPTPIQEQTIPLILSGKDVLGLAQTGTGKTAAFALPIIQKLTEYKGRGVKALVVAPTRELASQLKESFSKYAEGTNISCTAIFGGVPADRQLKKLKAGVDIVIGCPGRLLDHVRRGSLRLGALKFLVLDEADQMFDMGFLPDIKKLVAAVPKERQTLLFSATMPEEIESLAHDVLTDPATVRLAVQKAATTINQSLFEVSSENKAELFNRIVSEYSINTAIVFARTKHRVQSLAKSLSKSGFKVAELQGNLSFMRRKKAIEGFKDGQFQFLVATDLASRGLDISELDYVINYDIPQTVDSYIHRIGRTGRATREGHAFTFASNVDNRQVRAIERVLGNRLERKVVEGLTAASSSEGQSSERGSRDRRGRSSSFRGKERSSGDRAERGQRSRGRFSRDAESGNNDRRQDRSADRPESKSFSRSDDRRSDGRQKRNFAGNSERNRSERSSDNRSFENRSERSNFSDRSESRERPSRDGRSSGFRSNRERNSGSDSRPYNKDFRPSRFSDRRERDSSAGNDRSERSGRQFKRNINQRSGDFRSERRDSRTEGRSFNKEEGRSSGFRKSNNRNGRFSSSAGRSFRKPGKSSGKNSAEQSV